MAIQIFDLGPKPVDFLNGLGGLGRSFFDSYNTARRGRLEEEQVDRQRRLEDNYVATLKGVAGMNGAGDQPTASTASGTSLADLGRSMPTFVQTRGQMADVSTKGLNPQLNQIIEEFQKEFPETRITSGYRDPTYNAKVGGAGGSQHIHGNAFDFSVRGIPEERQQQMAEWLRSRGIQGFGYYPNSQSMHADIGAPRAWGPDYTRNSLGQTPTWFQQFVGNPNPVQPPDGPPPVSGRSLTAYAGVPKPVQVASVGAGAGFTPDTPPATVAVSAPMPQPRPVGVGAPVQVAQATAPGAVPATSGDPFGLSRMAPRDAALVRSLLANPLPQAQTMAQRIIEGYRKTESWKDYVDPRTGAQLQVNTTTGERKLLQGPQDQWSYQDAPNGDMIGTNAVTGKREVLSAGERDAVLRQYNVAKREGFQGGLFDFKRQLAEAGASKTNVNTNPGPAAAVYKSVEERADQARSAASALPSFAEAKRLLDSGQIILGIGADQRLALSKIGALLGLDPTIAANTETFRSVVAPQVLALVKGLGSGSGISNADREFAERAAAGNIALEPEAIKRMMDIGERAARLSVQRHNALVDRVYPESDTQNAQVRALFRVDVPENAPPPAQEQKAAPAQEKPKLGSVPIPPDAVKQLRSMPDTPATRAQFDEIFGEGAAARLIGKPK